MKSLFLILAIVSTYLFALCLFAPADDIQQTDKHLFSCAVLFCCSVLFFKVYTLYRKSC